MKNLRMLYPAAEAALTEVLLSEAALTAVLPAETAVTEPAGMTAVLYKT